MIKKIILISFLLVSFFSVAQAPPPGCRDIAYIDSDNDGYTEFDLDWYLNDYYKPYLTAVFGFDLSGYSLQWQSPVTGPTYTNMIQYSEYVYLDIDYVGGGPSYDILNFGPAYFNCFVLNALPANGDFDNDGILNSDEDRNGNMNLNDDDSDIDWNADFLDHDPPLATTGFNPTGVTMHPNPANGMVHFNTTISEIELHTFDGKTIRPSFQNNTLDISSLPNGTYIVTGKNSNGKTFTEKLIKI